MARRPNGRWLKADALDHDAAHDLIGAQDLAWDVAGAAVEFALDAPAVRRLIAATGVPISPDLLTFLRPCYLAFRLGNARLAERSLEGWPAEAARNRAAGGRYRVALVTLLDHADAR
jgi:hypothetical protein